MAVNVKPIRDMFVKALFGVGSAVVASFVVDFFRVPVLADHGLFGNASMSNYELFAYALSGGATMAGIVDLFSNSKPLGFSKEYMPFFAGFGIGTSIFEHTLKKMLIGNFDPYNYAYGLIPNIPVL